MKGFLKVVATIVTSFTVSILLLNSINNTSKVADPRNEGVVRMMPLVTDDPLAVNTNLAPQEDRGLDVRKWLSPSLKISVSGASGSGTIVYYDYYTGYAYIQSCGHLWDGSMSAAEGRNKRLTCKVTTWYKNDQKLSVPQSYEAEVLYYYNVRGTDVSLSRFKPDYIPVYFPIGPSGYLIKEGTLLHSCGCDGGKEVAHYDVEVAYYRNVKENYQDLVTVKNSPRPGRSGGGLMSDDGYYVGICWGTSSYDGGGNGYFTTLDTIREFNEKEGFGFVNSFSDLARKLPIIDRNNPQGKYPGDYIPLPNRNVEKAIIYFE